MPLIWTEKDQKAALEEGWGIWWPSSLYPEIEYWGEDPRNQLKDDADAFFHVRTQASAGSELHRKAINLIRSFWCDLALDVTVHAYDNKARSQ